MTRRTTLYAAFGDNGIPAVNVWDWNRRRLEILVEDRIANGEALVGERVVRCTVQFYDARLMSLGLPPRTVVR